MIISASRRTDIPAYYAQWFLNRLREGYVLTRNPVNPRQISKISLRPDVVDGWVFWTKNPVPIMEYLRFLGDTPYYLQFTLNAYGTDLEPGVPSKQDILIPAFLQLARMYGSEHLVWRYDPILLTPTYTTAYHLHYFEAIARRLAGASDTCVISFYDDYRHLGSTAQKLGFRAPTETEIHLMAEEMSAIAHRYGFCLTTCSEAIDLSICNIAHGRCIDTDRLGRIGGIPLLAAKDPNQRTHCGCAPAIDIGLYNCCGHGCRYCYANHAPQTVRANLLRHDPNSPLLYGSVGPEDHITERGMHSMRQEQTSFLPR